MFLNNAINHGVLDQLGVQQVQQSGKSILFLLEANPGPGAGLLLAFTFFGVGIARATAPGAFIIQFLGGIHEVYFPFVLSKPILLLAVIAGGATGVATNVAFHSGLVAPASPGSIFAILFETSKDSYVGVILSVVLSAAVSFLVTAVILRASRKRDLAAEAAGENTLEDAIAKNAANKGGSSRVGDLIGNDGREQPAGRRRGCRRRSHYGDEDQPDRLRVRRRHGVERHGCNRGAKQAEEGGYHWCYGREQGDREPHG